MRSRLTKKAEPQPCKPWLDRQNNMKTQTNHKTKTGSGCWLQRFVRPLVELISSWSSRKIRCESANGTLPQHRVAAHRWLTEHDRMAGALRTIRRALKPSAGWLPKNSREWVQSGWLKTPYLGAQIINLYYQILIRRLEVSILIFQTRQLTVKSRKLLAQVANMNAHHGSRAMLDDELLNKVEGCKVYAHNFCDAKWPNEKS